jgi:hypothetical protein
VWEIREIIKEVSSVNEFIKIIENTEDLEYFRGESQDYGDTKITASAFRGKFYNYIKLCQEFYNEVSHKLTQDEKENFLAFSQHHYIPTNLIDITSNPLVSLWFACVEDPKNKYKFEEDGFVYCFANYDNLDITEAIREIGTQKLPIDVTEIEDDKILSYRNDITEFVKQKVEIFDKIFSDINNSILISAKRNIEDNFSEFYKKIFGYNDFSYFSFHMLLNYNISFKMEKSSTEKNVKSKELPEGYWFPTDDNPEYKNIYVYKMYAYKISTLWSEKIKHFPKFIYKPLTGFNRFVNQQSAFFYQMNVSDDRDKRFPNLKYKFGGRTEFKPNLTIKIKAEAKKSILKTLDMLSINRKTVYSDYDSTAAYIKEKYENRYF